MSIDIRHFIDIDIIHHSYTAVNATRDTVVLMSNEGTVAEDKLYISISDYQANGTKNTPITDKYANIYFNNGGNKLKVRYLITKDNLANSIVTLPDNELVVAWTGTYDDMKTVAREREADASIYGIKQKILCACTKASDTDKVKNFAVKYSTTVGAEMTIAAYLSQFNAYGNDSVHDYAFTSEVLPAEEAEDKILTQVLTENMNVDMYLASAVRNLGGNLKDGLDLVNEYVLIILQQTLTDSLLNLLSEKVKGTLGLSKLHAAMSQELTNYNANGYLATDKIWTEPDLDIVYNGRSYNVIKSGTALLLGYTIKILPMSALSEDDKALHKTPPIYLMLADSYGIRKITINGEVI